MAHISVAQTWSLTGAPTNYWQCIAASADGSRLIAGAWPGPLYLSTNSGTTWTPIMGSTGDWSSVASSADGTKLLAASVDGPVLTSADSGATWMTNNVPNFFWASAASSADGNTLAVASPIGGYPEGAVFVSTNGGLTWTSNYLGEVDGVTMSADGAKIIAAGSVYVGGATNFFWRSTNSGLTWTGIPNAPPLHATTSPSQYIASSADGKKLIYALPFDVSGNPGSIYVSTNSGDTWNPTAAPSNNWYSVASSADGNVLLAVPNSGIFTPESVYLSTNCGATWTTNSSPNLIWGSVACSADGGKIFAAAQADANFDENSGSIYSSQFIQAPSMAITAEHGDVLLSWLVPSTNFVLQESTDLFGWTEVTNAPVLNLANLQNEVTLPSTNTQDFYRLKRP